ncbi:MAG: AcrR family transcriptional regulator [Myxococcota bacterium]
MNAALQLIQAGEEPGLRAVARHAGVSPGAPYHHFANKHALLAAVAKEGFTSLNQALDAQTHDTPEDRLRAVAGAYVSFAISHAGHYRVMFEPQLTDVGDVGLESSATHAFQSLRTTIAAVSGASGSLQRALNVWSLVHGTVMLHLDGMVASLDPSADTTAIAEQVGLAALALAVAPSDPS